mmetsp:Transcript_1456/g.4965  ORF Transcript_1456/g.4965 Transcript_1456/m.4965 type:complete len:125 (-) Transcript_1456:1208-1582(-)
MHPLPLYFSPIPKLCFMADNIQRTLRTAGVRNSRSGVQANHSLEGIDHTIERAMSPPAFYRTSEFLCNTLKASGWIFFSSSSRELSRLGILTALRMCSSTLLLKEVVNINSRSCELGHFPANNL